MRYLVIITPNWRYTMQADYTIAMPVDDNELKSLQEGEIYSWIFTTNEDSNVRVRVIIQHITEEEK